MRSPWRQNKNPHRDRPLRPSTPRRRQSRPQQGPAETLPKMRPKLLPPLVIPFRQSPEPVLLHVAFQHNVKPQVQQYQQWQQQQQREDPPPPAYQAERQTWHYALSPYLLQQQKDLPTTPASEPDSEEAVDDLALFQFHHPCLLPPPTIPDLPPTYYSSRKSKPQRIPTVTARGRRLQRQGTIRRQGSNRVGGTAAPTAAASTTSTTASVPSQPTSSRPASPSRTRTGTTRTRSKSTQRSRSRPRSRSRSRPCSESRPENRLRWTTGTIVAYQPSGSPAGPGTVKPTGINPQTGKDGDGDGNGGVEQGEDEYTPATTSVYSPSPMTPFLARYAAVEEVLRDMIQGQGQGKGQDQGQGQIESPITPFLREKVQQVGEDVDNLSMNSGARETNRDRDSGVAGLKLQVPCQFHVELEQDAATMARGLSGHMHMHMQRAASGTSSSSSSSSSSGAGPMHVVPPSLGAQRGTAGGTETDLDRALVALELEEYAAREQDALKELLGVIDSYLDHGESASYGEGMGNVVNGAVAGTPGMENRAKSDDMVGCPGLGAAWWKGLRESEALL
ncbi:hypothetical protein N656DRAFT_783283 [Canariomyces notabilis]|uniref:Uncharacterized protein n=1 Tax=Canariomyces notabilis TaxID=2074819 RepID=A0AAN6QJP4_9PEZI|nr:hypothetical protein N656DRAFT_783283 [Canariomyces arenarius]